MLTRKTYTNSATAEAAILPGVSARLRVQVARELARLLEHGCSIENPRPAGPVKSQYHPEKQGFFLKSRSAIAQRLPRFEGKFIAIRSTKVKSPD
jgi:hypothetical protein